MDPETLPRHARVPAECRFSNEVAAAAARLETRLARLDGCSIEISDYIRGYLARHQAKLRYTLQKDSYLLMLALSGSGVPLEDFVLVDYGGGVGTLSMLAREVGVGTVIYLDVYDVSCRDAAVIAGELGCTADRYVHGEMAELLGCVESGPGRCDAVVSVNVIEHVYDIDALLVGLAALPGERLAAVLATTANPFNPARQVQLRWKHHRYEHSDRRPAPGHKGTDTLESYVGARRGIISRRIEDEGGHLTTNELNRLAAAMRGLAGRDVEAAAVEYLRSGALPRPGHRTNTCDPTSGNWMERLMNPYRLAGRMADLGFVTDVLPGYYASSQPLVKALAGPLNWSISRLRERTALLLAPSYILHAKLIRRCQAH
ncbi:MAG: class I SAM-dependent methyltransferase [Actinobacteria bacterium]|nr:class I SAM-dependent methyltransferase [Actinomycetota bacterium]MBU1942451.1 class I SAM-dependent methyltransferase [Actinomycetota bacterium]MBU2686323.1 class I SAM-dependent methyltransferase [Actinomycetota bacterium]